jgi:hypothetical protein
MTAFGVGAARENITFGRIAGSPRADYVNTRPLGSLDLWENTGSGGTRLKGDGVRYCDMMGRGRDDYLWIDKGMCYFKWSA